MKSVLKPLSYVAKSLERVVDTISDHRFFGSRDDWKIGIRTYATYGDENQVRFRGRVLRDHAMTQPTVDARWYPNLHHMFHALESDEIAGVNVEVTFRGNRRVVQSDEEGYIDEVIELDHQPLTPGWHEIDASIVDAPYGKFAETTFVCPCIIPDTEAPFGVISDIDDTVLQSEVTSPIRMMSLLLFGSWHHRLAVEGTPDLYQSLVKGEDGEQDNPVFYVSSSPWNLHPMLHAFMKRVGLPTGPMMLRDLGIGRDADLGISHGHKEVKIKQILDTYPEMKFVLLGDAGQEDAAIYARVCQSHPDQVLVAYIRQVDQMPSERVVRAVAQAHEQGRPVFLLPGTTSIQADALKRNLIRSDDRDPTSASTMSTTTAKNATHPSAGPTVAV